MKRLTMPLTLTALAALAVTLVGGAALSAASDEPRRETKIKLLLHGDEEMERIELEDLHDLALGESRSFTTESGKAGVVTRTDQGFELDLDGRKIVVADGPGAGVEGEGNVFVFHKKIEIGDGDDARTLVWHSADEGDGHQMRVIKGMGGPGEAFAFAAGPHAALHAGKMTDAWIERLRQTAEFQGLDTATREAVEAALRATAPKPFGTGADVMVIDVEEREDDAVE